MKIEVRGLQELEAGLLRLGAVAGAKAMRQAMFAATRPMLQQVRANLAAIPGGSGALHAALGRTFTTSVTSTTVFTIKIGPKPANRRAVALHNLYYHRRRRAIYYGHLVEWGHRIGNKRSGYLQRSGRGKPRRSMVPAGFGRAPGKHYFERALSASAARVASAFVDQLRRRVTRALKNQTYDGPNA